MPWFQRSDLREPRLQARDGALDLINRTCDNYPAVKKLFADGGYAGEKLTTAVAHIEALAIEIVKRSDQVRGFVVLPKRWIVERIFAWFNRCRRLAKDWEASVASAEAWMFISSIRRMTRRIARLEF
ncbi:IS5/IS1182 family transposase [Brucella intermedia]|uniref:IS5/IS1182 family transposase n=1 Tax=Brucella intermedia TaxID=94625 RepID=UPI000468A9C3